MTNLTLHVNRDGVDYRIEIHEERVVMSRQSNDGTWTVAADVDVRAAEVLASLDSDTIRAAGRRPFAATNAEEDDRGWVSAMPHAAISAVADAADAVRIANHASAHLGDFDHHGLYRLIGELSQLAHRLPQLIGQSAQILRRLHGPDRVDVDHGNIDDTIAAWNETTTTAATTAGELADQIDRAFCELSTLQANIPTAEPAAPDSPLNDR